MINILADIVNCKLENILTIFISAIIDRTRKTLRYECTQKVLKLKKGSKKLLKYSFLYCLFNKELLIVTFRR